MALKRILIIAFIATFLLEAKAATRKVHEISTNICDPVYNNTNKIQCYCDKSTSEPEIVRSADCYLTVDGMGPDDINWKAFDVLKSTKKLTLTNARGITLKYIPTNALKHTDMLTKLIVKYGNIAKVEPFAFANLSSVEEITLGDNQIEILEVNAFAHHNSLTTVSLDKNKIIEINRDVFVDLPSLEKLFLTSNKITTIHDRAFIHLTNLRELEIDANSLFSLNSETFSGLTKLQKLDMSSNSLEVIGDNTFLPLVNLKSLNLDRNKIQMLDNRAFNGLSNMQFLLLAHNKLTNIDNLKVFEGLKSLTSLSLKGNQIRELKPEVMAPILNNFYESTSELDVEDNNFPCDCRLDWFRSLMNETQNNRLKLAIENLKCYPSTELKEMWQKTEEQDKSGGSALDADEPQAQNNDYEYYDDTQLNGKLFYFDVRDLLNCTKSSRPATSQRDGGPVSTSVKPNTAYSIHTSKPTKATSSPLFTTSKATEPSPITEYKYNKFANKGILDLSHDTTTKAVFNKDNEIRNDNRPNAYTTIRLATVSAKPIERKNTYEDHDMASDEAKPDRIKAHRSIQAEVDDNPKLVINDGHKDASDILLIATMFAIRLFF